MKYLKIVLFLNNILKDTKLLKNEYLQIFKIILKIYITKYNLRIKYLYKFLSCI